MGKGVLGAVNNVNGVIADRLKGMCTKVDRWHPPATEYFAKWACRTNAQSMTLCLPSMAPTTSLTSAPTLSSAHRLLVSGGFVRSE